MPSPAPALEEGVAANRVADNANVWDILEKALQDLMDMCDVVTDKFVLARDEHRAGKAKSADKTKTDKAESADKMETD